MLSAQNRKAKKTPKSKNKFVHLTFDASELQESDNALDAPYDKLVRLKDMKGLYYQSSRSRIPVRKADPFIAFSVSIDGDAIDGNIRSFAIRVSKDGKNWGEWDQIHHAHEFNPGSDRFVSELMFFETDDKFYQFTLLIDESEDVSANLALQKMDMNFFSPGNVQPSPEDIVNPGGDDSQNRQASACTQPSYVNRIGWGCPDGQSPSCSSPSYTSVTHIIMHHSADSNNPPSGGWGARVLAIWNYHIGTFGWCDIGYNWMIDPNGQLYEGRGGGDDVVAAHFCGTNLGTMGVCIMGDYTSTNPSTASLNTSVDLLAWKCVDSNISNPAGTAFHSGSGSTLYRIADHNDGCSTLCPGTIENFLPQLRSDVASEVSSGCSGSGGGSGPSNDDPCSAQVLTVGSSCNFTTGNNIGATNSSIPLATCDGNSEGDVWFRVTVPASGHLIFDTDEGSLSDVGMAIYSGSCTSMSMIECDQHDSQNGIYMPYINRTGLTPGSTVYIRVWEYLNNATGTFQICVYNGSPCSPPSTPTTMYGNFTPCEGSVENYSVDPIAGVTNYTWAVSGGTIVSGQGTNSVNISWPTDGNKAIDITVSNSCGSAGPVGLTLTVNNPPNVYVTPGAPSICSGQSVSLTGNGASTYSWSPSTGLSSTTGTTVTASPTSTTTYTVTGTDANGCTDTRNVTVTISGSAPPAPTGMFGVPFPCVGETANYYVDPIAGATNYSWTASGGTIVSGQGTTSINVNWTSPDTQTVFVTVSSGCGSASPVGAYVIVSPTPNVSVSPSSTSVCSGQSATLVASGANSYTWSPSSGLSGTSGSTVTASPSSSTNYTVTGTSNGCSATANASVVVNSTPNVSVSPSSTSICTGQSASLSATGATSYTWSPSTGLNSTTSSSVTASPTGTTTYTVTGTNSGGCSDSETVTVTVGTTPNVNISPAAPTICSGNTVTLTASGAGSYTWSPSNGLNTTSGSTVVANPATSTTYTVIGTTGNCTHTRTVTVTVNTGLSMSVSPSSSTICAGDNVTLTASGADSYTWSPSTGLSSTSGSSVVASPLSTTTYTVTGNTNGCTDTRTVTVTVNTPPSVNVTPPFSTICEGSSATLTASGASTYTWSPSTGLNTTSGASVVASPPSGTTYTVTGMSNGCTDTRLVTVNVTPSPEVSITTSAPSVCAGGSTILLASGASTYTWSPSTGLSGTTGSSVAASPSSTTTYTVTGTSSGCSASESITITVGSAAINVTSADPSICEGESATLVASGGNTYTWSPSTGLNSSSGSSVMASPTSGTTYTVTGTDANGCTGTADITVSVSPLPSVNLSASSSTLCSGESTTLSANGASSFTWSPGTGLNTTTGSSVIADPTTTTTYTVTGTSAGCSAQESVTLTVNASPSVSVSADANTICPGESAILTASGADTYTWSPSAGLNTTTGNAVIASPNATTTYTVTGTSNGCTESATVTITVDNNLDINVTPTSVTLCAGDPVTLSASGANSYIWSPTTGLTTTTGTSVVARPTVTTTYTVTGTAGGCTGTEDVTVTVEPAPSLNLSVANPTLCAGESTTLSVSGADSYTWSPGLGLSSTTGSTVTASPSSTTNYTVTGSSPNGCTSSESAVITVNPVPSVSVTPANTVLCVGSSTTLTASGADTYTWSPSSGLNGTTGSTVTANPTTTTTYTVIGISGNCADTATAVVTVEGGGTITVTPVDPTICQGLSTNLTASGAGNYTWSPATGLNSTSGATVTASPASTTTYTVTGTTGGGGCPLVGNVTVNVNSAVGAAGADQTICAGQSTVLTAAGGASYFWSTGASTQSITVSPATSTSYFVGIIDANGCTGTDDVLVNVIPTPTADAGPDQTICQGQTINLTASGGSQFVWNNGATTSTNPVSPSFTTTYTVTVGTGNCVDLDSVTVNVNTPPSVSTSATPSTCNNANGAAAATATGNNPFSYHWSNGPNTSSITNLISGTYDITVTDNNNCSTTESVFVGNNGSINPTISTVGSNCGLPNGLATVSVAGGSGNYSYAWSDGQSASTAINLQAGAYTVTIQDLTLGCTRTEIVMISGDQPINANVSTVDASCGDPTGSATVIATGGAGGFTYAWSNGQNSATATNLSPGNYVVTVTDANNCSVSESVVIGGNNTLTATISNSTDALCGSPNGSATVLASGGTGSYSYAWSNGQTSTTATGLTGGTHSVTVTDTDGCTADADVNIAGSTALNIATSVTDASCGTNNGSVVASVSGGSGSYTYAWSNGTATSTMLNISAGNYTLNVTDSDGCTASESVTVNGSVGITASTSTVDATCGDPNGEATVSVSGGSGNYTYAWSDGQNSAIATGLAAGSYNVVITDANGCETTELVSISTTPSVNVMITGTTDDICGDGSTGTATATANGGTSGYSYSWSNGQTGAVASGLTPGNYNVTVTDGAGCTDTENITVNGNNAVTASFSVTDASCGENNGSATVLATGGGGGFTYLWDNGETTATTSDIGEGTYTVTVTDANNCSISESVTVGGSVGVAINSNITHATCGGNNGSATVNPSGGTGSYTYSWDTGSNTNSSTSLPAGIYNVWVTDTGNGCIAHEEIGITTTPPVNVNIIESNDASCGGNTGNATAAANGGVMPYNYLWSTGEVSPAVTGLAPGIYSVSVTDGNGCTTSENVVILGNSGAPLTASSSSTNADCGASNGSATVSVSGGGAPYVYSWDNGQSGATANGLAGGVYTASITDSYGCTITESVTVNSSTSLNAFVSSADASCGQSNGTASISVSGGSGIYTYNWSTGASSASVSGLAAGTYSVTVSDNNGCSASETVVVDDTPGLTGSLVVSNEECGLGNGSVAANVSGGSGSYTYNWNTGASTTSIQNLNAGTYSVFVLDANGCSYIDSAEVTGSAAVSVFVLGSDGGCDPSSASVAAIASGGTGNYSYSWSNGQIAPIAGGLATGIYNVTVADANGCTATGSAYVVGSTGVEIAPAITDDNCNTSTGSVTANVTGGTGNYTFLWSTGANTPTIANLSAGIYLISVTDANGCSASELVTVNNNDINIDLGNDTVLCGSNLVLSAPSGAASYLWSNGATSAQITVNTVGLYWVEVDNGGGCVGRDSIMIDDCCGRDVFEPNDTRPAAAPLPIAGVNRNARICEQGDEDWYSFYTTLDRPNLRIWLHNLPEDYNIELYHNTGFLLGSSSNLGTDDETIISNFTAPGEYYLRVYGNNDVWNGQIAYNLHVDTRTHPYVQSIRDTEPTSLTDPTIKEETLQSEVGFTSLLVYPNPTDERFYLSLTIQEDEDIHIKMFDLRGRIVMEEVESVVSGQNTFEFETSHLAEGMYMIEVQTESEVYVEKLQVGH